MYKIDIKLMWVNRLMCRLRLLGIIHTIHGPLIIIFPFFHNDYILDLLYLDYFFMIIFSYTLLNQECPISFLAKYIENPNYIAGSRLNYFPEMREICSHSTYFFMSTTTGYAFSVLYVIYRLQLPYEQISIPLMFTLYYLLFPERNRYYNEFLLYQEIVKYIMALSLYFTTRALIDNGL